jgi:hypothetical protein
MTEPMLLFPGKRFFCIAQAYGTMGTLNDLNGWLLIFGAHSGELKFDGNFKIRRASGCTRDFS